jgi:hypothetical protein
VATIENVAPVYQLLHELGMRTTKTVWPVEAGTHESDFAGSQTLEDPAYLAFVQGLQQQGFEITWHGPAMETSVRARTLEALERYRNALGSYPRIHVNHSHNTENIYWGGLRFDSPFLRVFASAMMRRPLHEYSQGHIEGSPYWWGDACARHITYARNLTTSDLNTARYNPSMPYRDPRRPLVPWWFSSSDANDVGEFNALLAPPQQERLERAGGFCIVATHFGKGFATEGRVDAVFRERLTALAARAGWFPTAGELLDWLRARRERIPGDDGTLPAGEWRRMQWTWMRDLLVRRAAGMRPGRRSRSE